MLPALEHVPLRQSKCEPVQRSRTRILVDPLQIWGCCRIFELQAPPLWKKITEMPNIGSSYNFRKAVPYLRAKAKFI